MTYTANGIVLPDGWLTNPEASALVQLATNLTVLELGAFKGRSTVALASTARYVLSVDHHRGDEGTRGAGHDGDTLAEYIGNVRDLPNVGFVVAPFARILPLLAERSFGLAFIDGAHDAPSVERDATFASRLAPVLAFHDWNQESVRRGAARAGFFDPQETHDSLAVFRS